jgi:hypothetical protein
MMLAGRTYVIDPRFEAVGSTMPEASVVNIAEEARLHETVEIEISEQVGTSIDVYLPVGVISDASVIDQLVESLNVEFLLAEQTDCSEGLKLLFRRADGSEVEVSYACQMATPAFLYGDQPFWQGRAIVAPDRFNDLVVERLTDLMAFSQS